jgi:3-oxoacyl-[acyl-carrier-protein] synthase II
MSPVKRRVFITRAGLASAAGNDAGSFSLSISSLKSGIRELSRIDTSRLRTRIGGECDTAALLEGIGFGAVNAAGMSEKLNLSENPKLLFALHAIGSMIKSGAFARLSFGGVRLFTGAGLEEISVQALRDAAGGGTICAEPPSAFLGEIISGYYGFGQPPATLVSACSASTMAIGEAFKNIRAGALDAAVAGGTDSMLSEFSINAFNSIGALSEENRDPSRAVRPFDKSRAGTILGEGAAYFLIESESGIEKSGNAPLAEIAGYGSSMDAYNPVQPDPAGRGASLAMARALKDAGMTPDEIDYINAHGTATYHNDITETLAIKNIFKQRGEGLVVSSTKPYFGHLVSAAGAIELASVLYAFETDMIPPTLNLTEAAEGCDLNYAPGAGVKKRIGAAMKNSFGLNGQNASLVIKRCGTPNRTN